jgi:hypothetical protein
VHGLPDGVEVRLIQVEQRHRFSSLGQLATEQ